MTNHIDQTLNHVEPATTTTAKSPSSALGWITTGVFSAALAVALAGWWHETNQVSSVRQELNRTQQQIAEIHGQFDQTLAATKAQTEQTVAQMNEQVEKVRKESAASTARVQNAAKQQAGKVMVALNEKNKVLADQLEQMKKDNTEASSKVDQTINGIKGDVGDVKVEVASAKSDIDQTKNQLSRMTGDMGVMSGLIATNSTELAALRKLGERDYIEFTLPKTGAAQRVGDIQLALRKTDLKRSRFTLDVLADDKRVEKKDKTINEPVQFYTSSTRTPYEVVINQVAKDKVVGYLSIPKVKMMAAR
jgi:sortase (surface protein transpeptidase)